jgi:hypothetical protein
MHAQTHSHTHTYIYTYIHTHIHPHSHMMYYQDWPEPYIHIVFNRMYGDFPAKNTVCKPRIRIHTWFWPTLCAIRVGQNRINMLYMSISLIKSQPRKPYVHRIYMVLLANTMKYH